MIGAIVGNSAPEVSVPSIGKSGELQAAIVR